jgi:hypothetical protein
MNQPRFGDCVADPQDNFGVRKGSADAVRIRPANGQGVRQRSCPNT